MLKGKHILLGITGSIAAYKAAILIRLLVKEGAEVKIIMTPMAKEFITPLTLATLAKNPILVDFFNPENGDWNSHVDLGLWADAYLIAPATANTIGKMANGIADNLLLTSYLSARCPVFVALAMDLDMYLHPANQNNLNILRSYGNHIIEPTAGELASGLIGKGRMEEPKAIADYLCNYFQNNSFLAGKKVLLTVGPTYEKIDSVRFIGNYSSGKMGYALAEELAQQGADVLLISGPTAIKMMHPNIQLCRIESAEEMYRQAVKAFPEADVAIMCAAVADFTPENVSDKKIKRGSEDLIIKLKPTKDIAVELGKLKSPRQVLIGFALETDNEEFNALKKLQAKNLDFIVLNSLNDEGAGFGTDTNKISIIDKHDKKTVFALKPKNEIAKDIVYYLITMLSKK
ncbi:MAG: bifunctional phosphopantothenoylcysteine decarboxylase/phosphopantothenate--cysteine ligase CoaBC [Prevotellaceae bacterium]|jgi:phosphopantothenoylcysteine decarboxylase/phosphopantothenate--cysteine ligase|nr:bifunctional phosphopantothenoylcysteine decarboxylase/phosphopantothenate--cysteine ligase CoaBC [Prevotellaceae bacterium]